MMFLRSEVARFESEFLQYLDRNHAELLAEIAETGLLGDELLETLHAAVKTFKENWSDTLACSFWRTLLQCRRENPLHRKPQLKVNSHGNLTRNSTAYRQH